MRSVWNGNPRRGPALRESTRIPPDFVSLSPSNINFRQRYDCLRACFNYVRHDRPARFRNCLGFMRRWGGAGGRALTVLWVCGLHFNLSANPHLDVVFSIFPSTEAEKSHRCAAGDWGDNRPKATSSAQLFARRRETFFRSAPFSPPSAAFWAFCVNIIFLLLFLWLAWLVPLHFNFSFRFFILLFIYTRSSASCGSLFEGGVGRRNKRLSRAWDLLYMEFMRVCFSLLEQNSRLEKALSLTLW